MKILVTGSTGLVGSHLTQLLVNEGYDVRCLAEPSTSTSSLAGCDVELVYGDVRDPDSVEQAVKGCQIVYHLAAKIAHPGIPYQTYYDVNVGGTRNITQACLNHRVDRLIHGSTTGVYGTISHPPVNEKTPANPDSPYRRTKWMAEQWVMDCHRTHGLPVVVARLTSVTGARAYDWSGLLQAISRGNFRGVGTGENHHHTVDINDAVQGLLCCGQAQGIAGQCYILASEEPIQIRHLINLMAEELGVEPINMTNSIIPFKTFGKIAHFLYRKVGINVPHGHRYDLFITNKVLDISKAKRELGYAPKISTQASVHDLVNWFKNQS